MARMSRAGPLWKQELPVGLSNGGRDWRIWAILCCSQAISRILDWKSCQLLWSGNSGNLKMFFNSQVTERNHYPMNHCLGGNSGQAKARSLPLDLQNLHLDLFSGCKESSTWAIFHCSPRLLKAGSWIGNRKTWIQNCAPYGMLNS